LSRRAARLLPPLLAVAIFLILGAAAFIGYRLELDRPTERSRTGDGLLRISPGASLRTVARDLSREGWIRSPLFVAQWGRVKGLDRAVFPGRYRLRRGWTARRILDEIALGRVETTRVTIPEGWREAQIVRLLADSLEIGVRDLQAAVLDTAWVRSIGIPRGKLEGYLFPETYIFPKEYDPRGALRRMVREADRRFDGSMRERADAIGWSRDSVIVLASIVQAEAAKEREMPRIAAVFHNRLRHGWRLDADPTVLYAIGRFSGPPRLSDLRVESPYNTYRAGGLPPGPIGNPGAAALRAVLWPDSMRDEFYFVADGSGEHIFTRTLGEHNRARREARRSQGGVR